MGNLKHGEIITKAQEPDAYRPPRRRGRKARLFVLVLVAGALVFAIARYDFRPASVRLEEQAAKVEALIAAGRGEDARAVTPELMARFPKPDDLKLRLGRAYLHHGDVGPAVALLSAVEPRLMPEERLAVAEYFLVSGDPFSASRFFEAASKDLKSSPQLLARHAEALALSGQGERAAELFARSVIADPRVARTHLNLAMTLANLGRFDEASKEAAAALELEPGNEKARELLRALKTAR